MTSASERGRDLWQLWGNRGVVRANVPVGGEVQHRESVCARKAQRQVEGATSSEPPAAARDRANI